MRAKWLSVMAVLVAACGGGGELADETQRRSAEQALDTTATDSARARPDTGYRVPAFVDAVPAAETAPDTLGLPDGAPAWTNGVVERSVRNARMTTLREIRAGRNEDFDRVVVDFGESQVPSYRVEYAVLPVKACGSGEPVSLEGTAAVLVHLRMSQAHDDNGRVTVPRADIRAGMPVLRQVSLVCDFEGEVVLALGVAAAKPYRVLVEPAPNRLIVDVRQ
jgi:hypothetical protein